MGKGREKSHSVMDTVLEKKFSTHFSEKSKKAALRINKSTFLLYILSCKGKLDYKVLRSKENGIPQIPQLLLFPRTGNAKLNYRKLSC